VAKMYKNRAEHVVLPISSFSCWKQSKLNYFAANNLVCLIKVMMIVTLKKRRQYFWPQTWILKISFKFVIIKLQFHLITIKNWLQGTY
jgi:hypothetical protein